MTKQQTMLWPFFCFYGGKWRSAPKYPSPKHFTIIEPFAGAAGYSVRHHKHDIILVEKDCIIASVWKYLIGATRKDILDLPLISDFQSVDALDICQAAKYLIGFWLNKGCALPCKKPSLWMRQKIRPNSFWGEVIRERIANQVEHIKHWEIIHGDYSSAPDVVATWFIDPPYSVAGKHYRENRVNFSQVGKWCLERKGQVIACENTGADWLPFQHFMTAKSNEGGNGKGKSHEAIWTN